MARTHSPISENVAILNTFEVYSERPRFPFLSLSRSPHLSPVIWAKFAFINASIVYQMTGVNEIYLNPYIVHLF